jgi:hypothetical protein
MSIALVLYGKIGSLSKASSFLQADMGDGRGDERGEASGQRGNGGSGVSGNVGKAAAAADVKERPSRSHVHAQQRSLIREGHESFVRHVLAPNPDTRVEVFAHSWNPSLGALIDLLYRPVASTHEREKTATHFGGSTVRSALASIKHALGLKMEHERKSGWVYELAMLMRYDVAWHAPLHWPAFPRAQVWAVAHCCGWQPSPTSLPSVTPGMLEVTRQVRKRCLGSQVGEVVDYCRVSRYQFPVTSRLPSAEAELNYNLNDWVFFAPSTTLDTLRHVAPNFGSYRGALRELGIELDYMHFMLALHIHDVLKVSGGLRGAPVHVTLVRHASQARCYAPGPSLEHLLPPPMEPILDGMRHVCAFRGAVRCFFDSLRCGLRRDSPLPAGVNYSALGGGGGRGGAGEGGEARSIRSGSAAGAAKKNKGASKTARRAGRSQPISAARDSAYRTRSSG